MTRKQERIAWLTRALDNLGIEPQDHAALLRIQSTLHRWHELECGDSNDYKSWAIERDEETGKPFMVTHFYERTGLGRCPQTVRELIADREMGALKRLAAIMAKYPNLWSYVQPDPRGCALYVGTPEQLRGYSVDTAYNHGVAVCID